MNTRDKLVLAGSAVLLASLGAVAMLSDTSSEELAPRPVRPERVETAKAEEDLTTGTKRLLDRVPDSNEVPQEFKEAENYLESRWGHLGDSGLVAPGILPEGDMYFQEKRLIRGVRGNGKPIYAKAFLRPEKFVGPAVKSGAYQGLERGPRMTVPELTSDAIEKNVARFARKSNLGSKVDESRPPSLEELPGSGFQPRNGSSDAAGASSGSGGGGSGGGGGSAGSVVGGE